MLLGDREGLSVYLLFAAFVLADMAIDGARINIGLSRLPIELGLLVRWEVLFLFAEEVHIGWQSGRGGAIQRLGLSHRDAWCHCLVKASRGCLHFLKLWNWVLPRAFAVIVL